MNDEDFDAKVRELEEYDQKRMAMDFGKDLMITLFTDEKESCFGFEYVVQCLDANIAYMTQPNSRIGLNEIMRAMISDHKKFLDKNSYRLIFDSLIDENIIEQVEVDKRNKSREDSGSQKDSKEYRYAKKH